jgi:hypothetical protein
MTVRHAPLLYHHVGNSAAPAMLRRLDHNLKPASRIRYDLRKGLALLNRCRGARLRLISFILK